ncbi:hypothetical protein BGW80DRAFT_1547945 [Lactifluus volemus]|nr:hypothetical protein BGW80DRAFT_1547945 [Lactifluus volemus]
MVTNPSLPMTRSDLATPVSNNSQTSWISGQKVWLTLPTSNATRAQQSSSTNVTARTKRQAGLFENRTTEVPIGGASTENITIRLSTPSHNTTGDWGTSITCSRSSKRVRVQGPAHVKPLSLEIDNHQMWPTTVIPDLKEGAASQSQVQMSGSRAQPLMCTETFVIENPNDTSSDGDIVEEAHGDSDYEMVDAEEEPSGVSEVMALGTPLWQDSEYSEEVPDDNHGIDHIVASRRHPITTFFQYSFCVLLGDMLFNNAYPDAFETLALVQNAVLTTVQGIPAAKEVHAQLLLDPGYLAKIVPLPCTCISLFRRDVKTHCDRAVEALFGSGMMTPEEIAHSASHQLLNYNYIFPQSSGSCNADASLLQPSHH